MRSKWLSVAVAAVMGLGWVTVASAAPVSTSYNFEFDFDQGPFRVIDGSFTITFDDQTPNPVAAVDSFTSNLPTEYGPVFFRYDDPYIVIGNNSPTFRIAPGDSDFVFVIDAFRLGVNKGGDYADYSTPEYPDQTFLSSRSSVVTPVYLPASAPLFGAALLALGGIGYASRRAQKPA